MNQFSLVKQVVEKVARQRYSSDLSPRDWQVFALLPARQVAASGGRERLLVRTQEWGRVACFPRKSAWHVAQRESAGTWQRVSAGRYTNSLSSYSLARFTSWGLFILGDYSASYHGSALS